MRTLALLCWCLLAAPLAAGTLKPFKTDGCSMWIDGPPGNPRLWRHCCVAHDFAYWIGGTRTQRSAADEALRQCIYDAQRPMIASQTTFYGVRMGGGPYWPMGYRWGFGWNYWDGAWPRGYKTPTAEEQVQIDQLIPQALDTIAEDAQLYPATTTTHSRSHSSKNNDSGL